MNQLPFSVYDFFGYLASGAVVLAGFVAAFLGDQAFKGSPTILVDFLLIIAIYALGHVIANLAGNLIEHRIVREGLGTPTEVLFGRRLPSKSEARFFGGYFKQLPPGVREQVGERAGDRQDDDLFYHCHAQMKSNPAVMSRLDTFLNLYGFSRNTCLAMLIAAAFLAVGIALGDAKTGVVAGPGWWLALALLAAIGLFYRYLKFYRHYAVELFVSYAETKVT